MSDRIAGFLNRSIEDVQSRFFLRDLPRRKGRFKYLKAGLKADVATVVLFQYRAHIVASAVFVRDEKLAYSVDGFAGVLHFRVDSIQTFQPIDVAAMRDVWPWFKAFGHAKQSLNPTLYPKFRRRLKQVRRQTGGASQLMKTEPCA